MLFLEKMNKLYNYLNKLKDEDFNKTNYQTEKEKLESIFNDLIKSKGKPPKLVEAIIHLDEWVD